MKFAYTLGAITLAIASTAYAHSGPQITRFVAADGKDQGACTASSDPCRSLRYVLKQSTEGDEVRIAEGSYRLRAEDRLRLLGGVINIEGGYSRKDGFQNANPQQHPTIIAGVPGALEARFIAHGFAPIQDEKGGAISDALTDKSLRVYQDINKAIEGPADCIGGMAGSYPCNGIDLLSHIPLNNFSTPADNANDIIGFADKNDGREYALIGLNVGTAVVDVTDAAHPREVGLVKGVNNLWRDISVYQTYDLVAKRWKAYGYVTSEGKQGLHVLDLTGLPNKVANGGTISSYFTSAHTLYINTDYSYGTRLANITPHLFIAGAGNGPGTERVLGGSMQILDLVDPLHPKQVFKQATATRSDYMHDSTGMLLTDERTAQCASGHNPCEILFDYNENSIVIWDVTDKIHPARLSETTYPQNGYSHSGWYSADKKYLMLDDELDEESFGIHTRLRTFDISDLKSPKLVANFTGPTHAIDHNSYVRGTRMYMSHYRRGMVVMDASDPVHLNELASFDTSPAFADDAAEFNGAWGAWPFLPSGHIIISDIENGLYVLRDSKATPIDSSIAFVATRFPAVETDNKVTVAVHRNGIAGAVKVHYATVDGTALAGSDYTVTSGDLQWADGDSSTKLIDIPVASDGVTEGLETFSVRLRLVSGKASLSGQGRATVNLRDHAGLANAANADDGEFDAAEVALNDVAVVDSGGGETGGSSGSGQSSGGGGSLPLLGMLVTLLAAFARQRKRR